MKATTFTLLATCLLLLASAAQAQDTTLVIAKDTLIDPSSGVVLREVEPSSIETYNTERSKAEHKSRTMKATMLSAAIPGLGQAYNGKYWKIPVLYGGYFALGYYLKFNHDFYIELRRDLINELEGKPRIYPQLDEARLRNRIDYFRRNRDYLIILTGLAYALNIVDANVDAHLKEFDVSDDLSMKVGPSFAPSNFNTLQAGVSVKFYFR
ncbi:DUF5683 domain-containing protein [Cytophagales bacterium LB-30]|uniref:DUF5683 domain-containing protein n=1 Tax=Shiella aurantiaca TaxID=3058365 RepID=A0ABT8F494_9BACT|nr:DUF5683 domain-containing protein [Shiella aurantiaca]MDN4165257.1 DUF5683 domain-containing protein [Shiella aurantiaca]